MNKLLALCTALLLSGGTAQAADASLCSPAPAYDWSGIWVGAQAGYVSGSLTDFAGTSSGPSGADVGLHGYYNFQRGNWVFGPYFELPLGQADGTTSFGETKLDWAFTGASVSATRSIVGCLTAAWPASLVGRARTAESPRRRTRIQVTLCSSASTTA